MRYQAALHAESIAILATQTSVSTRRRHGVKQNKMNGARAGTYCGKTWWENMVGVERFELPTSCSQSRRATRLRYTPLDDAHHIVFKQKVNNIKKLPSYCPTPPPNKKRGTTKKASFVPSCLCGSTLFAFCFLRFRRHSTYGIFSTFRQSKTPVQGLDPHSGAGHSGYGSGCPSDRRSPH